MKKLLSLLLALAMVLGMAVYEYLEKKCKVKEAREA